MSGFLKLKSSVDLRVEVPQGQEARAKKVIEEIMAHSTLEEWELLAKLLKNKPIKAMALTKARQLL